MVEPQPQALLIAVKLPGVEDREFESSLSELERLTRTLGYRISGRITQQRTALAPAAVLGEGKLKELADLTGGTGQIGTTPPKPKSKARLRREAEDELDSDEASDRGSEPTSDSTASAAIDLVVVDHDLTPSQLRNLERASGVSVLDRTGVIIEIFHRHAKSKQARLEVEIARLTYAAPRVRESPRGKERQQGRGSGEAALELDRRRIRERIAELRMELLAIQREQGVRRAHRQSARRVALVGYTNAGKSSWMRQLTRSDVLVEDKLFATLDTTVRALFPESRPRILISDTVGFIKKLPHDLVASFKSTLDEALEASLVVLVVDASDPDWQAHLSVTRAVLAEIGADQVPSRLLINKTDLLDAETLAQLRQRFADAWFVSARSAEDRAEVRDGLIRFFEANYVTAELTVPYTLQGLLSDMHDHGRVLEQRYEEHGVVVRLSTDPATLARLRGALAP